MREGEEERRERGGRGDRETETLTERVGQRDRDTIERDGVER